MVWLTRPLAVFAALLALLCTGLFLLILITKFRGLIHNRDAQIVLATSGAATIGCVDAARRFWRFGRRAASNDRAQATNPMP